MTTKPTAEDVEAWLDEYVPGLAPWQRQYMVELLADRLGFATPEVGPVTEVTFGGVDITPYLVPDETSEYPARGGTLSVPVKAGSFYRFEGQMTGAATAMMTPPEPTYPYPNRAARRAQARRKK